MEAGELSDVDHAEAMARRQRAEHICERLLSDPDFRALDAVDECAWEERWPDRQARSDFGVHSSQRKYL